MELDQENRWIELSNQRIQELAQREKLVKMQGTTAHGFWFLLPCMMVAATTRFCSDLLSCFRCRYHRLSER